MPSPTQYNPTWEKGRPWLEKSKKKNSKNKETFHFKACDKHLQFDNGGESDIISHEKRDSHINSLKL